MQPENTMTEIRDYFASDPDHPLKPDEFKTFWLSLTDKERAEYRKADITK